MDNRRVMKAYRDRSGRILSTGGLFSRVKRYFSGPSPQQTLPEPKQAQNHKQRNFTTATPQALHSNTLLADLSRSVTMSSPQKAATEGEDPNRILSAFFKEKGDKPITEVEYEGVMSLLERSKANITLPHDDKPVEPKEDVDASVNTQMNESAAHNHTFAPYSQTKLRNTSMFSNNSSFAVSDYKPTYHTFNESNTSRANVSMKRVYKFSGLPSPYQTRIKAPNFAARKLRRIAPLDKLQVSTVDVSTSAIADSTAPEPTAEPFRPKSKTANALLSILDGDEASLAKAESVPGTEESSTVKPLHNPYFRPKRRQVSRPSSNLNASDITSTVLHSKTEALEADMKDSKPSTSIFEDISLIGSDPQIKEPQVSISDKSPQKPDAKLESSTGGFSFGTKVSSEPKQETAPLFSVSKSESDKGHNSKPSFTFASLNSQTAKLNSNPATFTAPVDSLDSTKDRSEKSQTINGSAFKFATEKPSTSSPFNFSTQSEKKESDAESSKNVAGKPFALNTFTPNASQESKPTINFGATSNKSADSTVQQVPEQPKGQFSFGSVGSKEATNGKFGFSISGSTGPQNTAQTAPLFASSGSLAGSMFGALSSTQPTFKFGQKDTTNTVGDRKNGVSAEESTVNTSKSVFAGETQKANGVNGSHYEQNFAFASIPRIAEKVDDEKVKVYESLYQF